MQRNDELWAEEHNETPDTGDTDAGLRAIDVTPAGIEGDLSNLEMPDLTAELAPGVEPGALPATGTQPAVPTTPAAPPGL